VRLIRRFASGREWRALGAIDQLYDSLRRLYGARTKVASAIAIHFGGWIVGTFEVYLCLHFMGYPVDFMQALVIESLAQAVRGAAFAVPGALGAQEGGLIALCGLFNIPTEAALALSLVKRFADLGVGLPSLLLWHRIESRLRASGEEEADVDEGPSFARRAPTPPATLGPFYSYAPPRMVARLDDEELKKCA
jgi:putative membrane protein